MNMNFYKDRTVLVTGHTGFKGSWLCELLTMAGARVVGYAMDPPTSPSLFELAGIGDQIVDIRGDIRDLEKLKSVFEEYQPEVVFHLAAQPIVRESYANPVYTYETNVMGTVNLCECVRLFPCVKSFLNVTTDKVYENREWEWGYREDEPLDGFDPYSNSKSCSELVTHSYKKSFFDSMDVAVSTARAGNVIGGGDFAKDRILPDALRASAQGGPIPVRNPYSTRPYQHVLEPLFAYLMIAAGQAQDRTKQGYYNVGPDEEDCITTGELVDLFCSFWEGGMTWDNRFTEGPHEANFLKLDCSRLKKTFGWKPVWHVARAVEETVKWDQIYLAGGDVRAVMDEQIRSFGFEEVSKN